MKKLFTVIFLVGAMLETASAQTPGWLWAENSNGNGYEWGYGMTIDASGHIYTAGRCSGTSTLGGITMNPSGTVPYVEKFDSAGNGIWAATYTPGGFDYCCGFYRDKKNNTYVTGISGIDMPIGKFNSAGVQQWSLTISGASNIAGLGIMADDAGNVYVTGAMNPGSYTFGSLSLTYPGSQNGTFLVKLDSNGHTIWGHAIYGAGAADGNDHGMDLILDNQGHICMYGFYSGAPVFGSFTAPSSPGTNLFIARYDTAGNALSLSTASGASPDIYANYGVDHGIAIDSCSNLYITGYMQGTATFGNITVTTTTPNQSMFIAKCDPDNNWQWVSTANSASSCSSFGISLNKNNEIYLGGDYSGNTDFGNGVTISGVGLYVAKYANSTGQALWAQSAGTSSNTHLMGLAVDNRNYVYVTGDFSGSTSFGSHNLTNTNGSPSTIFFAKLDTVPPRTIVPQIASSYCPGSSTNLSYTISGTFNNGNTFTAQLSDSTGSFVSPVTLGDTTTVNGGNIDITIPGNTPPGTNYLIRVVSSNPATSSYVNGCGAYYANNVYVNTLPITIGGGSITAKVSNDTTICSGSFVQLHASGGTSYAWTPAATLNDSTSANPYAAPTSPQIYTVIVSNGACGSDTAKVTVNVNPAASVSVSPASTTACSATPVLLTATGATSYTWTPATGLNCYTCANPTATATVSTTYTVTGNGGACSNTFLDTITVANTAVGGIVTAVRDTICQGTSGNLTLAGNSSGTVEWQASTDNTTTFANVGDTLTRYKTTPLQQTTWYRATVGSGNCSAISDTVKLYVPPALVASFYITGTGSNQFSFNSDSSTGNIRSYHWDFGDGGTSIDSNPSYTYAKDSTYYVCLTLYDGSNCSYTYCRYNELQEGVPAISANGNWVVYPNPFSEQLTVSSKQTNSRIQSVEMYDVLGQLVVNKIMGSSTNISLQLDVSSLAKGMYYVMIRTADADYVQKVVKQ